MRGAGKTNQNEESNDHQNPPKTPRVGCRNSLEGHLSHQQHGRSWRSIFWRSIPSGIRAEPHKSRLPDAQLLPVHLQPQRGSDGRDSCHRCGRPSSQVHPAILQALRRVCGCVGEQKAGLLRHCGKPNGNHHRASWDWDTECRGHHGPGRHHVDGQREREALLPRQEIGGECSIMHHCDNVRLIRRLDHPGDPGFCIPRAIRCPHEANTTCRCSLTSALQRNRDVAQEMIVPHSYVHQSTIHHHHLERPRRPPRRTQRQILTRRWSNSTNPPTPPFQRGRLIRALGHRRNDADRGDVHR
mmetsp:Transcript_22457/g.49087  ORF Transcript_22457/g.49087 Transcript_22457/m.49087 type:complete len:299 (-) Transcript_22457:591-1487(-)